MNVDQSIEVPLPDFPPVPLTLEGSSVLHQFFRFDWKAWRACAAGERERIAAEAVAALQALERAAPSAGPHRALLAARPQGRPDPRPLPRFARSAEPGRTRARADRALRLPHSRALLRLGRRTRPLRVHAARPTKPPRPKASSRTRRSGMPKSPSRSRAAPRP